MQEVSFASQGWFPSMSSAPQASEIVFDLQKVDVHSINDFLAENLESDKSLQIMNAHRHDCLGSGSIWSGSAKVTGSLGDYCWGAVSRTQVEVVGNVHQACGCGLDGGSILVHGNAGDSFGCFALSGWLAVYGSCGNRCGVGADGAEIVVRGSVGHEAGFGMRKGVLVVGGSAGKNLGKQLVGGTLFIRGEIQSLAEGIEEFRLKDSDRFKLSLLMLKAGIIATGKEFRGFRKGGA